MIRLEAADLADGPRLWELAKLAGLTPEEFRKQFGGVV
jgi:hypothetical protein